MTEPEISGTERKTIERKHFQLAVSISFLKLLGGLINFQKINRYFKVSSGSKCFKNRCPDVCLMCYALKIKNVKKLFLIQIISCYLNKRFDRTNAFFI